MKSAQIIRKAGHLGSIAALCLLAGCELFTPVEPVLTPRVRPSGLATGTIAQPQATSETSAALRSYLTQVQSSQLTQGLLRQDGGGPDTPYSAEMLARNFEQIVFFNEYDSGRQRSGVPGELRRWEAPIRMGVVFGASVPPSQRQRDLEDVTKYAKRLSQATGHPITVGDDPNFLVFFVNEDERADTIAAVAPRLTGVSAVNLGPVRNLPDDVYCAVAAYAAGADRSVYTAAVAVIRAENPDLLRLSCIHEELAQGLGLANDSPDARPSIFNDDDEFALLTSHDEVLLGMLYDRRLSPGMSLAESQPMIRVLATEAMQQPS
ncbi:DUF2927 domain-containing protein [Tateyamaria pelophila]|uniref:DUF2927 domain-containing protein n=1 Tax=Tateyamaria pelophila TaxID=328415 RepID=UPI001CBF1561|nr:DUF2927 domain-containing protein [Tateyamaria pelophila]